MNRANSDIHREWGAALELAEKAILARLLPVFQAPEFRLVSSLTQQTLVCEAIKSALVAGALALADWQASRAKRPHTSEKLDG